MKYLFGVLLSLFLIASAGAATWVPKVLTPFYSLRIDPTTNEMDLWLSDELVNTGMYGPLLMYLRESAPANVQLHLIGYGGSVTTVTLLMNALAKHNVVVHVHGSLYSAHALLLCTTDGVVVFHDTSLEVMYHGVQGGGEEEDKKAFDKMWTRPFTIKHCSKKTISIKELDIMLDKRIEIHMSFSAIVKRLKSNGIKVIIAD